MPLDLLTLRVVLAVAESGSISAGSDRLQLAVAAASARISALEAELGVRIFERSPRGVEVTSAGRLLVQRGASLLREADRLATDLRDWGQGLAGSVRMLANASAILEVLPARLERFRRTHPRIQVELEERMTPHILGQLMDGRADVGVVDAATPTQGLEFVPFFRDALGLVVPHAHRLAGRGQVRLPELLDEDFVVLEGANAVSKRLFNAADALGRPVRVAMQMRSFDAACRMVAAGLGVAVLPREALAPQLACLPITVVPIDEPWVQRTNYLALRTGHDAPQAARTLVEALRQDAGG
ncbi:MAG TPA: LysR family transcriptional regulator [Ramlibacter sp.]|jgi:DNA-binding transcriptional LysR family regulator|uniref:LysR family transcriptional regulator n=1 Tax=Ramlibacter sp. TaxID=1917967 RepID=UPI002D2678C7|nr:LysR family transcriptional regulator [Ramlibacter sp.]HZY17880.1 LysR family transcriptional regulator [Ramlibacter sp.]